MPQQVSPAIKKYYGPGANGYVIKPVGFEQFQKAISGPGLFCMIIHQKAN